MQESVRYGMNNRINERKPLTNILGFIPLLLTLHEVMK